MNFILKANADNCPHGIAHPTVATDWETAPFNVPQPKGLVGTKSQVPSPEIGNVVHIWVNQESRNVAQRGNGYAGCGIISSVEERIETSKPSLKLMLRSVRLTAALVGGGLLNDSAPEPMRSLHKFRLVQLLYVDDALSKVFEETVLRAQAADTRAQLEQYEQEIRNAFKTRVGQVLSRTAQRPFRRSLIASYGLNCCVTGPAPEAVLHAAHIIPIVEHPPLHRFFGNGLLMRADIHLLFDAQLLAINPTTFEVEISSVLQGTLYEGLAGKRIAVHASQVLLDRRYQQFRISNEHQQ